MRAITSHKVNPANDKLSIAVLDEPGAGGANHEYEISGFTGGRFHADGTKCARELMRINFQNGPINENGVNGVTQEALLAIVIDRLQSFQKGPYACRENALALTHIETGLLWLLKRTIDRMARGVEGTHQK